MAGFEYYTTLVEVPNSFWPSSSDYGILILIFPSSSIRHQKKAIERGAKFEKKSQNIKDIHQISYKYSYLFALLIEGCWILDEFVPRHIALYSYFASYCRLKFILRVPQFVTKQRDECVCFHPSNNEARK